MFLLGVTASFEVDCPKRVLQAKSRLVGNLPHNDFAVHQLGLYFGPLPRVGFPFHGDAEIDPAGLRLATSNHLAR